jgi:Ca2+-binding RTX toxin-like protein
VEYSNPTSSHTSAVSAIGTYHTKANEDYIYCGEDRVRAYVDKHHYEMGGNNPCATFYGTDLEFVFEKIEKDREKDIKVTCLDAATNKWLIYLAPSSDFYAMERLAIVYGYGEGCPVKFYRAEMVDPFDDIVYQYVFRRIKTTWSAEAQTFNIDVSETIEDMQEMFAQDPTAATSAFLELESALQTCGTAGTRAITQINALGNPSGTAFEQALAAFGNHTEPGARYRVHEGTDADDYLYGATGRDNILNGGAGNDTLTGYDGDDILNGGAGNDTLIGNWGNDILNGGAGNDLLQGGTGDDTYCFGFGYGIDTITDTAGTDTILLNESVRLSDVTITQQGTDIKLTLTDGSILIITGGLNPTGAGFVEKIKFANGIDADIDMTALVHSFPIYGTAKNDYIKGTARNETIYGRAGNDTLLGEDGDDVLYGEEGNDSLDGGNGNDYLDGGPGDDYLAGFHGDDTYFFDFGYGHDTIFDANGNDLLLLGSSITLSDITFSREVYHLTLTFSDGSTLLIGDCFYAGYDINRYQIETIRFLNGVDADISPEDLIELLPVYGNAKSNEILLGRYNDTVYAGAGNDYIRGYAGDDILYGEDGNDTIYGGDGDDILNGGDGADKLYGDAGNDTLIGGTGDDALQGGHGNDTYIFSGNFGADSVWDANGTDTFDFTDVAYDQLWFEREGNHLRISVLGTENNVWIDSWYYNSAYQIETINAGDYTTSNTALAQLIQAMAAFTKPNGTLADNPDLAAQLADTLQNTWNAKTG